jgi:hypothetical protein
MPTSNFLNTPFGGAGTAKFSIGGITELYLLPHSKLGALTATQDAFGNDTEITAIALATGATFQEIDFVEFSASYTDSYKLNNTQKYMEQVLNFTVNAAGADAIEQAHQILLNRRHVALARRKNGKLYLIGASFGLVPTEGKADSGAKQEDDAAMSFTLSGANLGFAPEVTLDATALAALVTRLPA